MNVERHGSGWRTRLTINKQRQWVTLPEGIKTEGEARLAAERIAGLNRAGALRKKVDVTAPEGEPFTAWCERWLAYRKERGQTSTPADRGRLRKWVWPSIGARRTVELTRADLEQVVAHLDASVRAGKLAWKTASNAWGLITSAMNEASSSKLPALRVRTDDPSRGVRGPDRGARRQLAYLYPDEAAKLLACDRVPVRWARLYALDLYLALRAGEVEALEVDDVDTNAWVLRVTRSVDERTGASKGTKSGRGRVVPIPLPMRPVLAAMVDDAQAIGRTRLVKMPPRAGHRGLAARLRAHLRRAGVTRRELHEGTATTRRITWHDLRATCVSWWCLAGIDGLTVQLWAGHSDTKTTAGYVRAAAALRGVGGEPHGPLPTRLSAVKVSPEVSPSASIPAGTASSKAFKEASPEGFRECDVSDRAPLRLSRVAGISRGAA